MRSPLELEMGQHLTYLRVQALDGPKVPFVVGYSHRRRVVPHQRQVAVGWALYRSARGPEVKFNRGSGKRRAFHPFYSTKDDCVHLPLMQYYSSPAYFFVDLFHELGHRVVDWLGRRPQRLIEEAAVEMAANYLAFAVGFTVPHYSIGWLQRWVIVKNPRNPRRTLVAAEPLAADIVRYVLR